MRHATRLLGLVAVAAVLAVPAAHPAAGAAATADCVRTLNGVDLQTATIPELQTAMAAGTISSAALTDAYLARIAAYNAPLNAIRQLDPTARAQAAALDAERAAGHVRGPLHGIPVLLKDNYGTDNLPTTAGSIALEGQIPKDDSTVTHRLRNAGAVILGKTNLSEFAGWVDLSMPPGYSSLGGQVVNANDYSFSPSGSSAGSGVAASMAFSGIAMGTETSGSILSPSDANGVVGLKTTLGLVSRFGILPLAPDFDVPGPMVRSVTDAAIVLGAIAGPDALDPATAGAGAHLPPGGDFTAGLRTDALSGVRLTYSQDDVDALDDEHRALFDGAVARVQGLGATVVPSQSIGNSQNYGLSEIGAIPNEFKASFNKYLADELPGAMVHSLTDVIAYNQQHTDKVKYGQNLLISSDATPGSFALFAAQAGPSQTGSRAAIDQALSDANAQAVMTPGNAQANIGAAAGYPTVMTPLGYTDGGVRPFGLGFMGKAYSEPQILGYAYAFEQASHARVPPTDLNSELTPASCPPAAAAALGPAGAPPARRKLGKLRIRVRRSGHLLRITIRGAIAARVKVVAKHGKRVLKRRRGSSRAGTVRLRIRIRRRGLIRIVAVDPGPPARTAHARIRIRR